MSCTNQVSNAERMEVREEYIYKCINKRAHSPRTCWHPSFGNPKLLGISYISTAWLPANRTCQHVRRTHHVNTTALSLDATAHAQQQRDCRDIIIYKAYATPVCNTADPGRTHPVPALQGLSVRNSLSCRAEPPGPSSRFGPPLAGVPI